MISSYTEKIVEYIAGFVRFKLKRSLMCEACCNVLCGKTADVTQELIRVKNKDRLLSPSRDDLDMCFTCENKFREKVLLSSERPYAKLSSYVCHNIVTLVLSTFQERSVFSGLAEHMSDSDPVNNHLVLLIKAVAEIYLQVRYRYAARQFTARHASLKGFKSRTKMNKLVLFSGM